MKVRLHLAVALPAAVALSLLALPLTAAAHTSGKSKTACTTKPSTHRLSSSASGAVFTFGISGGNMRPWSVDINADGTVAGTSWEVPHNTKLADPTTALNGLLNLASSEGFFSMPVLTNCPGTLPDIASRFITVDNGSTTRQVKVHGQCVSAFNQIFAVLENTADIQH